MKIEDLRWTVHKQNDAVAAEKLLLGLPGAEITNAKGSVKLRFVTDINDRSPNPIFEAAIILHQGDKYAFDLTLNRGRILLFNTAKEGAATVRVKFRDEVWEITLQEPGALVGVETFGRWAPGSRFKPDPKSKASPIQQSVLLVIRGTATLKTADKQFLMSAPPGPAIYMWDSVHGRDRAVKFLKELPPWAVVDKNSKVVKEKRARIERLRMILQKSKSPLVAVRLLFQSDDKEIRNRAPLLAGAIDALWVLAKELQTSKDLEVWTRTVAALRHWLGRGPGQDQLLFQLMTNKNNPDQMPEAHARTLIQLLHGFSDEDQKQPVLYDVLIHLLSHERLGIRGLAAWHLQHLAPSADIPFNPMGTEEEQKKIAAAWRKLIPSGKLPPMDSKSN